MILKTVIGTALFLALSAGTALAHGDLQGTTPAKGSTVARVPQDVEIVFTEAPAKDSRFEVLDGCDRDVFAQESGEGANRRLALTGGEPGRWTVSYRLISAEDGHFTKGEFAFRVSGKRDCTQDEVGEPGPRETTDDQALIESLDPANESTFPVVPILLAGAAVIVFALAARFFSPR